MKREAEIFKKALTIGRLTLSLGLAGSLLFATAADAQINRSGNPGSGSSDKGSNGSSSGGSSRGSDSGSSSGSDRGSSGGGSSRGSEGGSSRGSSGSSSGGSYGGSERTRTPSERGGSSGSSGSSSGSYGSRPDRGGSSRGSSDSGSGNSGIFNRSRTPGSYGSGSDRGGTSDTGSTRSSGGYSGGSRSSGNGGYSRSDSGYGSGSAADRLNASRGGYRNNGDARGSWANSREASGGRLAPFSYNPEARSRTNVPNNYERFLRSREGYAYRYKNGTYGRSELFVYRQPWVDRVFINSAAYYPYYRPSFVAGVTCYSPYAYFWGFYPGYITLSSVYYAPPPVVYVPYPVYTDTGRWRGYRYDDVDTYYLNQRDSEDRDFDRYLRNNRSLNSAVNDIGDAWRSRDIQLLARHTRQDGSIAVYLRGKYQYSLPSVDYLDMTRDAFRTSTTVRFRLDRIERKDNGVYLVSGRHSYRDKDDEERNVYVNYVLERSDDGEYYITQVGSSPDKLNDEE